MYSTAIIISLTNNVFMIIPRITVNTLNNLLVMNFEKVTWDYTLETDKVPPLVQYGSYSDAPVRQQPYPYIRAQRMRLAGASNYKIVHHSDPPPVANTKLVLPQQKYRALQLPHSAKSLSARSMEVARRVQSGTARIQVSNNIPETALIDSPKVETKLAQSDMQSLISKRTSPTSKHRVKSAPSQYSVTIKEQPEEDETDTDREIFHMGRRISWAFDKPLVPQDKDITLSEIKALLRSQIRMKKESVVPPDFIYLTINTIQNTMAKSETNYNTNTNMQDPKSKPSTRVRPSSSPSRIDPRSKVPIEELNVDFFISEDGTVSEISDHRSVRSVKTKEQPRPPSVQEKEVFSTLCASTPICGQPRQSMHPTNIRSTVPAGRIIRPISAGPLGAERSEIDESSELSPCRPITAPVKPRHPSVRSVPASIGPSLPGAGVLAHKSSRSNALMSSALGEARSLPMLMYSEKIKSKATELKEQRKKRQVPIKLGNDGRPLGNVSQYNQPMRDHATFELRTYQQEEVHAEKIQQSYVDQKKKTERSSEKRKRAAWIAMATGKRKDPFDQEKMLN